MSKLSNWILEDYGTNKCTLKHTINILKVFAQTNIELSYYSYYDVNEYSYSMVHPEWNLHLFVGVGVENDIVAYNMNSRKVHVITTHYSQFRVHQHCKMESQEMDKKNSKSYGSFGMEEKQEFRRI